MSHVRQQIREAAALDVTGLATSGSRVYQSRVKVLGDAHLPCLLVSTEGEVIEVATVHGPAILDRRLTLSVTAVAKATDNLDDTLDTMAAEVETALGDSILGGLAKSLVLQSITPSMEQAEKGVGALDLRFEVNYMTEANAPSTAI